MSGAHLSSLLVLSIEKELTKLTSTVCFFTPAAYATYHHNHGIINNTNDSVTSS